MKIDIKEFQSDRILQAKEKRKKYYYGDYSVGTPYSFSVPAKVSNAWINGCPYNFREMINDSTKLVEGQLEAMKWQIDSYPDCDYLPFFKGYIFGEGVIPSMLGQEQIIVDDIPPVQKGRIMKSIYDIDKLPDEIDPSKGLGPQILEGYKRMIDASQGIIPIEILDHQSPYGVATKLLDNEELMLSFYDEPELAKKLIDKCAQYISQTIDFIGNLVGFENLVTNLNLPIGGEKTLILWDDYISVISPNAHKEFCLDANKWLFNKFGRGHLHSCGPYFDGFVNAIIANDPISVDLSILRGQARTKEDMTKLRGITQKKNIILIGGIGGLSCLFDGSGYEPQTKEFFDFMAKDGLVWIESAPIEMLDKFKTFLN